MPHRDKKWHRKRALVSCPLQAVVFHSWASDEINEAANHRGRKDAEAMPGQQERVRPPGLRATSPGPENRDAPEGRSGAV